METQTMPRAHTQPRGKDEIVVAMQKGVRGEELWTEGKSFLSVVWSYSFWLDIHRKCQRDGAEIYSTVKRQIEELLGVKMVADSCF